MPWVGMLWWPSLEELGCGWNRWQTLAAGLFLMICAGPVFSFGAIAADVKATLHATEKETQLIAVAGNVGLWTNVLGGMVYDRSGPRPTLLAGAFMIALGYGLMYLTLTRQWSPLVAAGAWFAVGHGSGWVYISTLFSNLKNFAPAERGFVVGALACFFGASATVFVALLDGCLGGHIDNGECSNGFLGYSVVHYMALLGVTVPVVVTIAACFTTVNEGADPGDGDKPSLRFGGMLAAALTMVAFICGSNYYALAVNSSIRIWANYVLLAIIAMFFFVPAGASPAGSLVRGRLSKYPANPLLDDNLGPAEAALTGRFWALWFIFGATVGADVMTMNVLASIVRSRGEEALIAHICVIVSMGCDTFSRFMSGFVVGQGVSPTGLLICGPLLMCVGQLLLLFGDDVRKLYLACIVTGLSDGIMWSLGPLLTGKAFGLKFAGRNFGFIVLGAATSALLLGFCLEPTVYEMHTPPGHRTCHGHACFAITQWCIFVLGVVAAASAWWLHCAQNSKSSAEDPRALSTFNNDEEVESPMKDDE